MGQPIGMGCDLLRTMQAQARSSSLAVRNSGSNITDEEAGELTMRKPWARPISVPRSSGETWVRYAGRLDRKPATSGDDVTGVSNMPMNGSPFTGSTTCRAKADGT